MGTWNYKTSDVVTVAYYDINYTPSIEEVEGTMVDYECDDKTAEDICVDQHEFTIRDDFERVESIMSKTYIFYDVKVVDGYYEGFQIVIERIYEGLSWKERQEMQKELTQIKRDLITVIENDMMRVCYPGYCIGWEDTIQGSIKALNEAIKEERKVINGLKNR